MLTRHRCLELIALMSTSSQVVKPEDMSFAWKETGRGGACKCPNAPFFCHLCCAISKRPSMGHLGPTCPFPELDCKGTCHHLEMATPESMQALVEREEELTAVSCVMA
jgi:hypothetical protein